MRANLKEWLLLTMVAVLAASANLPDAYAQDWGVDRVYLQAALATLVIAALFHYLQFLLFTIVVMLAVGANLPAELADELGIHQGILLWVLGLLVLVSLLNHLFGLLPRDSDEAGPGYSEEGRRALLSAIERGNVETVKRLTRMQIDLDAKSEGRTPLYLAAERGHTEIVLLLLRAGADPSIPGPDGRTPHQLTLEARHDGVLDRGLATDSARGRPGCPA